MVIIADAYICMTVFHIAYTLIDRAYIGQATLKDNEVVKKFRAYDSMHIQHTDT